MGSLGLSYAVTIQLSGRLTFWMSAAWTRCRASGRTDTSCAEFAELWLSAGGDRWKLHFEVDDELVWLCPECDKREFGDG